MIQKPSIKRRLCRGVDAVFLALEFEPIHVGASFGIFVVLVFLGVAFFDVFGVEEVALVFYNEIALKQKP